MTRNCSREQRKPALLVVRGEGVEQTARAAGERRALGEVGHQRVEVGEVEDAVLVVVALDQADAAGRVERLEVAQEDRVRLAGRDVHDGDVVRRAAGAGGPRRCRSTGKRLRSIPITGVMPEPAVTNSSLVFSAARRRSGSTNSPAACSRWSSVPGRVSRTMWLLTLPSGHGLDRDRDPAVGARAVGQRVGAPAADAVDVDADPDVLARARGRPSRRRGGSPASRRRRSPGGPTPPGRAARRRGAAGRRGRGSRRGPAAWWPPRRS